MGFSRNSIEALADRWNEVERFNQALERLRERRLPAVLRIGDADISKLVWKIRVFSQVTLYRVVMAADGCADNWARRNILASLLCGRAVVETTAFLLTSLAKYNGWLPAATSLV